MDAGVTSGPANLPGRDLPATVPLADASFTQSSENSGAAYAPAANHLPLSANLVERVAASEVLCFDIDDTLNRERSGVIINEAAELIFQFMPAKQVCFISGRTFDELREAGTLEPLLQRLNERNVQCRLVVYTAGGGEKVFLKSDGTFEHDLAYTRPYSEWE